MAMFLSFAILTFPVTCCFCFVGYDMFPGFEAKLKLQSVKQTTVKEFDPLNLPKPDKAVSKFTKKKLTSDIDNILSKEEVTSKIFEGIDNYEYSNTTSELLQAHSDSNQTSNNGTTENDWQLPAPIKLPKFHCFENEKPANIGSYEVPSERDLVLLIKNSLVRIFNTYQQKALYFLKDIQEATKATADIESKCRSRGRDHMGYKRCVRQVSSMCEVITKNLITKLQKQRADLAPFIEGTICDVNEMKADPIGMIKFLTTEDATIEFALPSFLRFLGACSYHCKKKLHETKLRTKPPRHLTDQELVVRHLLSKKHPMYRMHGKDSKWIEIN